VDQEAHKRYKDRENSGRSVRLQDLIERLYEHDELAAEGIEKQFEIAHEETAWDDAPGAEARYEGKLQDLIDVAETILGAYEFVA